MNASGGLEGHPLKLILKDDAANPGTSVADVQALLHDHIDALADWSLLDDTWAQTVQASGIPVVGGNLSDDPYYKYSDFYPEGETNDSITASAMMTAKQAGASTVGIFYCAEAVNCQQGADLAKSEASSNGLKVSYMGQISATAPSYTAQCVAAQQAHVDAVFVLDSSPEVAKVGQDCSMQNFKPIYVTEGEGFGENLTTTPGVKDDLWSGYNNVPFWDKTPAVNAMYAAMAKYFPGVTSQANSWIELGLGGWPSGLLLADAVKAGGLTPTAEPSSGEIVKGLAALKGDTLDGMAPPLTFAAGKPHPVSCWFTAHVKNGTPQLVDGGKLTCSNSSSSTKGSS